MLKLLAIGTMALLIILNSGIDAATLLEELISSDPKQVVKPVIDAPPSSDPLFLEEQAVPFAETGTTFAAGFSASEDTVTLSAAHSTTSWDDRLTRPDKFELPVLYLHRQRQASDEADRTLTLEIIDLPAALQVQIELLSRHVDISTGDFFRTATNATLPNHDCTSAAPCTLQWTIDAASLPSDFYNLRIKDAAGSLLWEKTYPDQPDLVLLDTWDVELGEHRVRISYATLFPFARGVNDLASRLSPGAVTDFIEQEFVPIIINTWNTQFHAWGFGAPLHPDWDRDGIVEIFITDERFALFDGTGTYHRSKLNGQPYPQRRLWWRASNDSFQAYGSLGDAYRAVFAHEFFHLMQWNVVLSAGCGTARWNKVFIEAQGKFAPSVQYPDMEIRHNGIGDIDSIVSEYMGAANRFLWQRLNSSYQDMEADQTNQYDAALYWRFLYEQYDDMAIVRAALEEMACGYDADIVAGLPAVMDRVFQRVEGPFGDFRESLTAFARANYALRLENGRCATADLTGCGGFYFDPQGVYVDPPLEAEQAYVGTPLTYKGALPASFGMDFIEVRLDPILQGQPLTVTLVGEGSHATFNVQVWKLGQGQKKPHALTLAPEALSTDQNGAHTYAIPSVDTSAYGRLALIITRIDANEATDSVGAYHLTLAP